MVFANLAEVHRAYQNRAVDLHAKIKVRIHEVVIDEQKKRSEKTSIVETTVGRSLLAEILPVGLPFALINIELTKKAISRLINACYRSLGLKDTVVFADQLMYTGFHYATRAGISIGIDDMKIPAEKKGILDSAEIDVKEIQEQFSSGLVTAGERYNKVVDIWSRTNELVASAMMKGIGFDKVKNAKGEQIEQKSMNSLFIMADSGARGSAAQIRQLAGMRGLMARPDGSIIETPIKANFREGLDVLQYFNSTHGARKGPGRYRAEDRELGLPDPASGRRGAGRGRHRDGLRYDARLDHDPDRGRRRRGRAAARSRTRPQCGRRRVRAGQRERADRHA